jgi:MFS family permease
VVLFLPESPRWKYTHGYQDQARAFLTKYHGESDPDNGFVTLQISEFERQLAFDGSDKRFWDYRGLFRDRASCYRLGNNLVMSVWGQWTSGGLGYFTGGFYQTAGITNATTILDINLGTAFLNALFAYSGALSVDRIGRRRLLLTTLSLLCVCWICVTVGTAEYANTGSVSAARAGIAFNIIFGAIYSFGITPMQALYPVEVLSYEQRAKGMAFSSLVVSAAGLVNQFGTPVALENIGWKLYIIFAIWVAIEIIVVYFFLVETKGFTLEELDQVFASKNPVKASLQKRRIALDDSNNIIDTTEV